MVEPKRQKCRKDSDDPNEAKSRNDSEEPTLDAPQMENVEPMRLKFLNDSADAMIE